MGYRDPESPNPIDLFVRVNDAPGIDEDQTRRQMRLRKQLPIHNLFDLERYLLRSGDEPAARVEYDRFATRRRG